MNSLPHIKPKSSPFILINNKSNAFRDKYTFYPDFPKPSLSFNNTNGSRSFLKPRGLLIKKRNRSFQFEPVEHKSYSKPYRKSDPHFKRDLTLSKKSRTVLSSSDSEKDFFSKNPSSKKRNKPLDTSLPKSISLSPAPRTSKLNIRESVESSNKLISQNLVSKKFQVPSFQKYSSLAETSSDKDPKPFKNYLSKSRNFSMLNNPVSQESEKKDPINSDWDASSKNVGSFYEIDTNPVNHSAVSRSNEVDEYDLGWPGAESYSDFSNNKDNSSTSDLPWPNMRTDVTTDANHAVVYLNKPKSKLPHLLNQIKSNISNDFSAKKNIDLTNSSLEKIKKITPVSTGDLENWCFIHEAVRIWTKDCKKASSKSIIKNKLYSPKFYVCDHKQFAIASPESSETRNIAVDWASLNLVKAELENETQEKLSTISQSAMSNLEICRFPNFNAYFNTKKRVTNTNNALLKKEKTNSILRQIIFQWHKLKKATSLKSNGFVAIDCEVWEQNHNYLTEVGWAMYDNKQDKYLSRHYIIAEHYYLENKRYVQDRRDNFMFGNSVVAPLQAALKKLVEDIISITPAIIIGHDMALDLRILKKHGIDFESRSSFVRNIRSSFGYNFSYPIVDTSIMYMGLVSSISQKPSLSAILKHYKLSASFPHNAGNDAVYTMFAFNKMIRDEIPTELGKPSDALLNDLSDLSMPSTILGKSSSKSEANEPHFNKFNKAVNTSSKDTVLTYEKLRQIPSFKNPNQNSAGNNLEDPNYLENYDSNDEVIPADKPIVLNDESVRELDALFGFEM
ncbi:hypothetical protein BB560_001036 [Smittium megazygosporum]|uniref:Gfd2/YDR514C-like C-terminal domain-containing protein n=1 Tax=Smittium megazygosporum TaxID=133381 RepID=A0A2T9ZIR3_9FUNG|nr:hypothetical protein BB560_001036 [Smittium megazygosporum]